MAILMVSPYKGGQKTFPKGRAVHVRVVSSRRRGNVVKETLVCGHVHVRPVDSLGNRKQRACLKCRDSKLPKTEYVYALVDDDDFDRCAAFKWYVGSNALVVRVGVNRSIALGRFVLGLEKGNPLRVGYRNGDLLDNRRENLVTGGRVGCKWRKRNGFIGVNPSHDPEGRFVASILLDGGSKSVGTFDTAEQAARAFDSASRFYFGDLARTNFVGAESLSLEQIQRLYFPRSVHLPIFREPKVPAPIIGPRRSRYKNVSWDVFQQKWRVVLRVAGLRIQKHFRTEEDAHRHAIELRKKYGSAGKRVRRSGGSLKIKTHADRARAKGCAVSGDRKAYRRFILQVRSADRVTCYWCGENVPKSKRRIDHIIPFDKGGPDDVINLCCSCVHCNSVKGNKLPHEFRGQRELFLPVPEESAA